MTSLNEDLTRACVLRKPVGLEVINWPSFIRCCSAVRRMRSQQAVVLTVGLLCREKALLQAVTDNESAQAMLANVKLSMPGMQKAVQEQKKSKRQKGKGK